MDVARFVDRHRAPIAATAIGVAALLVRICGIGDKPFWLDELLTYNRAQHDVAGVVIDSLQNRHLPAYFLLVSLLVPWGAHEAMLRLPSALFGALAASLTFSVTHRIAGIRAGVLAGSLMALAPFQVEMGQEARSYAMVTCLILVALRGLVEVVMRAGEGKGEAAGLHGARGAWLAYVGGTAGALLTLPVAIPWFAAANLGAVFAAPREPAARRLFLRRWVVAQIGVIAIAAPVLLALTLVAHGHFAHGFDWVPPTPYENLWASLATAYLLRGSDIVSVRLLPTLVPGLGIAAVVLAAMGAWGLRRKPALLAVMMAALLALPVALLAVTAFKSMLVPRYFAWGAAPFFILTGLGLGALPGRWQTTACALFCLAALPNLLPYYSAETKPRWDLAAADLAPRLREGDVVLIGDPYAELVLGHFSNRQATPRPAIDVTGDVDVATALMTENRRVWAIYGRVGQGQMESLASFRARLASLGRPAGQMSAGRHIRILLFDPAQRERVSDSDADGGVPVLQ